MVQNPIGFPDVPTEKCEERAMCLNIELRKLSSELLVKANYKVNLSVI